MDYKAVVAETPHVVQYLRKSVEVPMPGMKMASIRNGEVKPETKEEVVKCGAVVAIKKDGKILTGWSVCSDRDNFSNAKGKAIAILRAQSEKCSQRNIPTDLLPQVTQVSEKLEEIASRVL